MENRCTPASAWLGIRQSGAAAESALLGNGLLSSGMMGVASARCLQRQEAQLGSGTQ